MVSSGTDASGETQSPKVPSGPELVRMHAAGDLTDDQFVGGLDVLARFNEGPEGRQALEILLSQSGIEYRDDRANHARVLARLDALAADPFLPADRKGDAASTAAALRQPDAGMLDVYRSIEPMYRQHCLDFLQSVVDDESLPQPDRDAVRVERDSITRTHETAGLCVQAMYEPGDRGDKALEEFLKRQDAAFMAAPGPADRTAVLRECMVLADQGDMPAQRRSVVMARIESMPFESNRMLQQYLSATEGDVRLRLLASLQTHLESSRTSEAERAHVQDELRRNQATRLLAVLDGNSRDAPSRQVAAMLHPVTRALMPHFATAEAHFDPGRTGVPTMPAPAQAVIRVGVAAWGAYQFSRSPSWLAAHIGFARLIATSFAQDFIQRRVVSGFVEGSMARLGQALLEPIKDSDGSDRTEEVVQAFERVAASLPENPEVVSSVARMLWCSLLDSAFASAFADSMSDDDKVSNSGLDRITLTPDVSRYLAALSKETAAPVRDGITQLEMKRMETSDVMERLDLPAYRDGGQLALNDSQTRALVQQELGGREPMHYDEGGLYQQVHSELVRQSDNRSDREVVRGFFEALRPPTIGRSGQLADRIDELVAMTRRKVFNLPADSQRTPT